MPKSLLIVDDEKNIRFTLHQALEPLEIDIDTAVNGEEALEKVKNKQYAVILLDLKMPGINGMEVLRHISQNYPETRVIIISAYGTIDSAVEAMKLGAVDFLQKPFAPVEIRNITAQVLGREDLDEKTAVDYAAFLELAKKEINEHHFEKSAVYLKKAIAVDSYRPEAYNLLGVLLEISHDLLEAQKNYRVAITLDPSYEPARKNLSRTTMFPPSQGKISWDE